MLTPKAQNEFRYSYIPDPGKYYPSRRAGLFDNLNLIEDIPKIDGFYSMYPKEEAEVLSLVYAKADTSLPRLSDFLGVSQMSSRSNLFSWEARRTALPLVTGGQKPIFTGHRQTLCGLNSPTFDPLHEVYLPSEARPSMSLVKPSQVRILSSAFLRQKVELEVSSSDTAVVVVAQTFYHGWKCYLDRKPVSIWPANHAFQAVQVPAGEHHLSFCYRDSTFFAGSMVSVLSLVGCSVLWRRHSHGVSAPPQ